MPKPHAEDELKDTTEDDLLDDEEDTDDDEPKDTDDDDDSDTDPDESGDDEPDKGKEEKEKQKKAWLANIIAGKKTLNDLPKALAWLKPELEEELSSKEKGKKKVSDDDLDSRIESALQKRDQKSEFQLLVETLEDSDLSEDQRTVVSTEYNELLKAGTPKAVALKTAMRLAGFTNADEKIKERRRKAMLLPPDGGNRKIPKKDKLSDEERENMDTLPPGFKPKKA